MKLYKHFFVAAFSSMVIVVTVAAEEVQFNTDLLDISDKENIDFGKFSKQAYILPGDYSMQVMVNGNPLGERSITFLGNDTGSEACLSRPLLAEFGLKAEALGALSSHVSSNGCTDITPLKGMMVKGELQSATLAVSIPQSYLDYATDGWDPPSRWDPGIDGAMLDYSLSLQQNVARHGMGKETNFSSYGVAGANLDLWRLRADWRGYSVVSDGNGKESHRDSFEVNRVYAYRPLPQYAAKLTLGEIDLNGSVIDSFRFTGASLASDDNMLPPNLRGYSPEVVGVAQTNAKVVISQQGRVIYETQVAAGPFRIQDLSSYVTGTLDVRVEEQNGESQTFQVKTANIPYLSRPGAVRYQFVTGRPSTMEHDLDGPLFAGGEFSWGVNNGWSLFGGGLLSERYGSAALGVGRDLLEFGAISFDMTESLASLPGMKSRHGGSYRVNYSKVFEEIDSQIAFAGYRFSDRNFMTMNDYLNSREYPGAFRGGSREMYTVQLSKQFPGVNMGGYLSYDHQSYWHQPDSGRISLNLSRNFDLLDWRGLSASLTAYRQEQAGSGDNGFYFSLSMPFGYDGSRLSYSASSQNGGASQSISYNSRLNERDYLNVTAGTSPYGENVSGFYSHTGDKAQMTASLSHQGGSNTAGAISVQGGVTATAKGSTLHRAGMMGGSRILVDTDGVADVPVYSSGPSTTSDRYGKAVVADVNSYYRQSTSVDVNQLGDEVEPLGSPIRSGTLMEGTIGYQHFDMLSGTKRMVRVVREDGRPVPFAATALNEKDQQLGMVADDGVAYLAGLRENSHMVVQWGDQQRCEATLPGKFPSGAELLQLSCRPLQDKRSH